MGRASLGHACLATFAFVRVERLHHPLSESPINLRHQMLPIFIRDVDLRHSVALILKSDGETAIVAVGEALPHYM